MLANDISVINSVGGDSSVEKEIFDKITANLKEFNEALKHLEVVTEKAINFEGDTQSKAIFFKDEVSVAMERLRKPSDELELLVDEKVWPFPTYGELLFNI